MERVGCVLAAVLLAGCASGSVQPQQSALPQDPDLQVFMNQNQAAVYRDPYRQIERWGDDLEAVIIAAIAKAQSSVDIAVQELRLPRLAQALRDRQRAGVKVRVILENQYARPYSRYSPEDVAALPPQERSRYQENFQLIDRDKNQQMSATEQNQWDALVILENAGIPVLDDTADGSAGSGLMHHKFIVMDGRTVIVTSANFTLSDVHGDLSRPNSRGNANNLLKINSPQLAQVMTQEFNQLWGDGSGGQLNSQFGIRKGYRPPVTLTVGQGTVTVKFSPDSQSQAWSLTSNGLIASTLTEANQSVDLALFVFSEQALADTLALDQQRGVAIRALIDPEFAYQPYSEALDLMGIALLPRSSRRRQCLPEANNHPWATPIAESVGVPQLPPGDKLHHKFAVLDQATVITGSHNWSQAANTQNDETLLVFHNAIAAAFFHREFERLYGKSILGIPPALQRKVEEQYQQCPSFRIKS